MGTPKSMTEKISGKTKEAVAEIIGDGKLREEGKAEQRKAEMEANEPEAANPLEPLDKLT
jgi:uncharacterized protein YjbJ (UPF0337 family)